MSSIYSVARDLDELLQMAGRLQEYLLSDKLYLALGGGFFRGGRPQLTLGAFLLRRRRLAMLRHRLDETRRAELREALARHEELQREWRLHYEKKLAREAASRLKLMGEFMRDCAESPRDCATAYPVEAMRRTILQEILLALDEFDYASGDLSARVERVDGALRRYLLPGDFIWPTELESVYAPLEFWWLYSAPQAN